LYSKKISRSSHYHNEYTYKKYKLKKKGIVNITSTQKYLLSFTKQVDTLTLAQNLSLGLLFATRTKNIEGNITFIITPMVDPISPNTTSILGINKPVTKENNTIKNVIHLKAVSAICCLPPDTST